MADDLSINLYNHGFTLYSFEGVALVYMYFRSPDGARDAARLRGLEIAWREAAENLGPTRGNTGAVSIPVLMPAILGSTLLVFGFGLSAYATADALRRARSPHPDPDRELSQRQRPGRPGNVGRPWPWGSS